MKQTIGINLYRLSLLVMVTVTSYLSIEAIRSGGHFDVGPMIEEGVITFFILLAILALRFIARYLYAGVKWWDFVALALSMTLLPWLFERVTYGTSWTSIYTLFVAISAFILLMYTFFQVKQVSEQPQSTQLGNETSK